MHLCTIVAIVECVAGQTPAECQELELADALYELSKLAEQLIVLPGHKACQAQLCKSDARWSAPQREYSPIAARPACLGLFDAKGACYVGTLSASDTPKTDAVSYSDSLCGPDTPLTPCLGWTYPCSGSAAPMLGLRCSALGAP